VHGLRAGTHPPWSQLAGGIGWLDRIMQHAREPLGAPAFISTGILRCVSISSGLVRFDVRGSYPWPRAGAHPSITAAKDADREMNQWLGPIFEAMIFAFTSIAVLNTLTMIALRRRRELGLLRLTGATPRQVRSMARWEAALIVTIGLGLGLAIAATALLPLSHAFNGTLRTYVPAAPLATILGTSALLALLGLALPTRRALRTRPVEAIGIGE
jgi:FtsX-like permease family